MSIVIMSTIIVSTVIMSTIIVSTVTTSSNAIVISIVKLKVLFITSKSLSSSVVLGTYQIITSAVKVQYVVKQQILQFFCIITQSVQKLRKSTREVVVSVNVKIFASDTVSFSTMLSYRRTSTHVSNNLNYD